MASRNSASVILRAKVWASLKDARPSRPASEVFRRLRERHARKMKSRNRESEQT
jgi:antitoxin ParD1/3/4